MSNTPSETEIDNLLCKHWPAYSTQAVLVKIWLREAIESAIAQWGTPQPVVREPLTEDQRSDIATAAAGFNWTDDYVEAIDYVIDGVERLHGIKGKEAGNADARAD